MSKKREPDPTAFDLDGEGEAIPLFPESDAEREAREAFYNTTPSRSREHVDAYAHTISVSGSLGLEEKLDNLALVTVQIADEDGQVIASGEGHITAGFKFHVKKEATIAERAHKVQLH